MISMSWWYQIIYCARMVSLCIPFKMSNTLLKPYVMIHMIHICVTDNGQNGGNITDDNYKCNYVIQNCIITITFHVSLFPGVYLMRKYHWFRCQLATYQATSHYLNTLWSCPATFICGTREMSYELHWYKQSGTCVWLTKWVYLFIALLPGLWLVKFQSSNFNIALVGAWINRIYYTKMTSLFKLIWNWATFGDPVFGYNYHSIDFV